MCCIIRGKSIVASHMFQTFLENKKRYDKEAFYQVDR